MDANSGEVCDCTPSPQALDANLFQMIPDTGSGKNPCSELHRYGQSEFVTWQIGLIT